MGRFLLVCMLWVVAHAAEPEVRAAAPDTLDESVMLGEHIIEEAYRRIGYRMTLTRLPMLRSLSMTNAGSFDAELGRVGGMEQFYPNLKPVPTSYVALEIVAVSLNADILPRTWSEFGTLRVGAVRGTKLVEMRTKSTNVNYAPAEDNLLAMLEAGRVDVIVLSAVKADRTLARIRRQASKPQVSALIERIPIFHYVHQRNQHLVPPLDRTLRTMLKDGYIDQVLQNAGRM